MDQKTKRKILIVDDEQSVRDLFARTLQHSGFDIVAVANPDEGIEIAKQTEPDIIYLSLLFPESNGLKVGKSMHSVPALHETPIVVLISYKGELDPKYTRTIGIVDVLVKPLEPADILSMTSKLLGEEIAFSGTPPVGLSEEDRGEDLPETAEEPGLVFASGSTENMAGDAELPSDAAAEKLDEAKIDEVTDVLEEADRRPDPDDMPPMSEDPGSVDSGSGGEESGGNEVFSDVLSEETEKEEHSDPLASEGGERAVTDGDEGEGDDWLDLEDEPEKRKKPVVKYVIVAGLVLLVAVVVFAGFETGILPSGSRSHRILPAAAPVPKRQAVKKDAKSMQQAEVEAHDRTEAVQPGQKKAPVKGPAASKPSSVSKPLPAAKRSAKTPPVHKGTKVVSQKLKRPKAVREHHQSVYSVQVGAFEKKGNATSLAAKLKKHGYNAFVEKTGSSLHRVLVGSFTDHRKALLQSEALLKKDGMKSVIYRH